jgi:hypothetical protein
LLYSGSGSFTNSGTIDESGGGLLLDYGCTLSNAGTYDLTDARP